jgi:uncharacterized protein YxjI
VLSAGPATFVVEQKITPMANRYRVLDGSGTLVAFAAQKRLALKEKFTVYADEDSRQVLFTVGARRVMEIGATYDVLDAAGSPIGTFRKEAAASLLNSTYSVEQPGMPPIRASERNLAVALLRRVVDLPFLFHFDGKTPDGRVAFSSSRRMGLRDRYDVAVQLEGLDHRLVIALAIAFDALQSR